jgi:methyltransferase (TIGR00027 family)
VASKLNIFEIDQPLHQAWKKKRLRELSMDLSKSLHFVPVNFEGGELWWNELVKAGFDVRRPAVVTSTGLSMYLTREAIVSTLRQISRLATGSTFAMTFMIPLEMAAPDERVGREAAERGARMSGTPFISFFTPNEILGLARETGFKKVEHISAGYLEERYFNGRTDGLKPSTSEEFLLART